MEVSKEELFDQLVDWVDEEYVYFNEQFVRNVVYDPDKAREAIRESIEGKNSTIFTAARAAAQDPDYLPIFDLFASVEGWMDYFHINQLLAPDTVDILIKYRVVSPNDVVRAMGRWLDIYFSYSKFVPILEKIPQWYEVSSEVMSELRELTEKFQKYETGELKQRSPEEMGVTPEMVASWGKYYSCPWCGDEGCHCFRGDQIIVADNITYTLNRLKLKDMYKDSDESSEEDLWE